MQLTAEAVNLCGISKELVTLFAWKPNPSLSAFAKFENTQFTSLCIADSAVNTPVLRGNKESDVANWWGPSLKQPHLVLPSVVSRQRSPPNLLLEESGMRLWHLPCVYRGAPLVEIRIRLSSPAFLTFPPRVTHAFFALWRDACAAVAAAGDAAGLSLSFSNVCDHDMADLCTVEGVTMTVAGFAGSTQRFVADIFECLTQMCCNLAVLERHRMQLQQPRSLLLDNNGVKAGIDQGKGESNGTAGVTTAVSAPAIIMHGSHAIGGNAPAPCMHHEDVAEAELMEDVALRRLDAAAMEQLDEVCAPYTLFLLLQHGHASASRSRYRFVVLSSWFMLSVIQFATPSWEFRRFLRRTTLLP